MNGNFLIKIICCFLLLLRGVKASAQHCPYDGMYIIVVHVPENATQPGGNTLLRLTEIDNNEAERCKAANGLLRKTFLPINTLLQDSLNLLPGGDIVKEFCSDCAFLGPGHYAVKLKGEERYCMLYDGDKNLKRQLRKFEISYGTHKIALPQGQVYRLCWAEGAWSRIQPVEVTERTPQKTIIKHGSNPERITVN